MARFAAAEWLGEHSPEVPMDRYDIVCVHTIVGYAPAHAAHFSTHHDGRIQQSRDTRYRSGANLNGNHRVIAIENEDHGSAFGGWNVNDGHSVPEMTDAQITANAKILAFAHRRHGVPLQLCPDSKPGSRGLAYHRQGIDGNFGSYRYPGRVSGGEVWTEHFGKVCPGDNRIAQLPEILRRAKAMEDDMPTLEEILDGLEERLADPDRIFMKRLVELDGIFMRRVGTAAKDRMLDAFANPDGEKAIAARQQIARETLFRVSAKLHLPGAEEPEVANLLTAVHRSVQHAAAAHDAIEEHDALDEPPAEEPAPTP